MHRFLSKGSTGNNRLFNCNYASLTLTCRRPPLPIRRSFFSSTTATATSSFNKQSSSSSSPSNIIAAHIDQQTTPPSTPSTPSLAEQIALRVAAANKKKTLNQSTTTTTIKRNKRSSSSFYNKKSLATTGNERSSIPLSTSNTTPALDGLIDKTVKREQQIAAATATATKGRSSSVFAARKRGVKVNDTSKVDPIDKAKWEIRRAQSRLTAARKTLASIGSSWDQLETQQRQAAKDIYKTKIQARSNPKQEKQNQTSTDKTSSDPKPTASAESKDVEQFIRNYNTVPEDDNSPIYATIHDKRREYWMRAEQALLKTISHREALIRRLSSTENDHDASRTSNLPNTNKTSNFSCSSSSSSPSSSSSSSSKPSKSSSPKPLSSYPFKFSPTSTPITILPQSPAPIATLSHSLQRVLFNPGIHFLQDPRSKIWNFPRGLLDDVPPIDQFEQGKMPRYVTSSEDRGLKDLGRNEKKRFVGSTSSTVKMLCQIYFWMSKGKEVNTEMLSASFQNLNKDFSMGQQMPASVELIYEEGLYSINNDKTVDLTDGMNILGDYGNMMEKLLTTEEPEFRRFLNTSQDPAPSEADHPQAYHYMATDHMVLRSQLDAYDPHLPNQTFDLKTRATIAIRHDRLNYLEGASYKIDRLKGLWNSFEREYYDLIRNAFLKYQFQARIGHMDGVMVAYHSTKRFYGFQYIPIEEMDVALFGSPQLGDQIFPLVLGFLEKILVEATSVHPERSIRLTLAWNSSLDVLRVFVTPHPNSGGQESDLEDPDLVMFELKGSNYYEGQPMDDLDRLNDKLGGQRKAASTFTELAEPVIRSGSPPAAGVEAEEASPSSSTDVDRSTASSSSSWNVGYTIERYPSTTDSNSSSSDDSASPTGPGLTTIRKHLRTVRNTQQMFSTLYLPSGISPLDLSNASKRIQSANDKGEEPDQEDVDLLKLFPEREGVKYATGTSKMIKTLRLNARDSKKSDLNKVHSTSVEFEEGLGGGGSEHYEMQSRLVLTPSGGAVAKE